MSFGPYSIFLMIYNVHNIKLSVKEKCGATVLYVSSQTVMEKSLMAMLYCYSNQLV